MNDQVSSYTKEELEKQKLLAEISNLNKHWIKNPASWISILTIVLALFGLAFQYRNHQFEARQAQDELAKEIEKLNTTKAALMDVQNALNQKEPRLKEVDAEIDKTSNELKQLASDREDVQNQLAILNAQLKQLEAKANSLPRTPDNQKIQDSVKIASVAVVDLQKKNRLIVDKSKLATDSLARAKVKSSVMSR
jgi:chromosome segregation ATPase